MGFLRVLDTMLLSCSGCCLRIFLGSLHGFPIVGVVEGVRGREN